MVPFLMIFLGDFLMTIYSFSGSKSEFLKAFSVFRAQKVGFWGHFQFFGPKK